MRILKFVFASLLLAAPVMGASANTGETPPTLDGAKTITAAQAKALVESGAMVLDVRRKAAYLEGRVPKAKSVKKNDDTKKFEADIFGASKDAPVLIYGHGSDGWSAVDAVKTAVAAGYKNVNWLRGGWVEWSAAGLPKEE